MSLILDALRKSEAERRIGQAPGLLSPSQAAPVRKPAPRLWLLIGLPLLLIALLVAAWWLGRQGMEGGSMSEPSSAAVVSNENPAHETPTDRPATNPAALPNSKPKPPAQATAAQPVAIAAPPPRAFAAQRASAEPGERESAPVRASSTMPPQPAVAVVEPPAPRSTMPDPVAAATASTSSGSPTPTSARSAPSDPPAPSLPTLAQLSAAERADLPPLRISMHVYSDDPNDRFVLIDNHRYGEGASIANGLVIAEIRSDSVVMEYRGHRFRLDRPG